MRKTIPLLRTIFVLAEVVELLGVNLRKSLTPVNVVHTVHLLNELLDLRYRFSVNNEKLESKKLTEDLALLRYTGTRLLPRPLLSEKERKLVELVVTSYTPEEIELLSRIKAEYEGIAPRYLTTKKKAREMWRRFTELTSSSPSLYQIPVEVI
jgi:hypothetical protein